MPVLIFTALKEHKGKARLWLEGGKLSREGILPESRFNVISEGVKKIKVVPCENGAYRVSKRNPRNDGAATTPIIDLKASELAMAFEMGEELRVIISAGVITITASIKNASVARRVNRLEAKIKAGEPLVTASLFHGGGVMDSALHAGFRRSAIASVVGVAVEMENKYLDSSLLNNPELFNSESVLINAPIESLLPSARSVEVDILTAGIPCTGASKAGISKNKIKKAEDHSEAGAMFFYFLEFVRALNPSIIIVENVPEYQNTASMSVIRSVLGSIGYKIQEHILCGNEYGVIEKRKRLCMVAISEGIGLDFDLGRVPAIREKEQHLADIIENVPAESNRWKTFSYLADKEMRDKEAGKGFKRQLVTGEANTIGTVGKYYAKCRSTEAFIVADFDPALSRLLTPLEHAKVKGIPLHLIEGLSDTVAHEILGQSVVYPAFEAVGVSLGASLKAKFGSASRLFAA